ncbi:hypothetical protein ACLOJK_000300 [Asimina triloba]
MTFSPSLPSCSVPLQDEASVLIPRDYLIREINALLWLFLIAITALLLRKIAVLVRLWAKGRKIPGPPCPSFYGHAKLIAGAGSGHNLTGESFLELHLVWLVDELVFWFDFRVGVVQSWNLLLLIEF